MDTFLNEVVQYLAAQSWQIAVLTVAVAAITFALRHRSAQVRYLLWLVVLAKCLVPPLYLVPLHILPPSTVSGIPDALLEPDWPVARSGVATSASPEASAVPVQESTPPTQRPQGDERRLSVCGRAGILWAFGAGAYLMLNLLRALRGHHLLQRNRKPLGATLQVDTTEMLRAYGMRRLPRIWIVEGVGQPFVWGLARGSVYIPPGLLTIESREHRRDVLAHELSHIVRFDAGVNCLQIVAQGLFWFHPLVWWANRQIRVEREKCCDETAIARLRTPAKDYCSAVVETLANMKKPTRPVPSLAVAGPIRNVEERIRTMLRPGKEFYKRPSLRAAVVVLLMALFTVPTSLVLSASSGTKEPSAATERATVRPADKETSQGLGKPATVAASTAHLGDLLRTFQDPNVNGRSWFGYSVATLGDNVLVGAAMNRAAHLFEGSTGKLLRTFAAPAAAKGRAFGWYVAAVGKNVLIADPADETDGKTPDGRTTGRAYLFNGLTGELLRTFGNPEPENYIAFGQAVSGIGDNRVLVGATFKDRSMGAAFLFDAATGKMLQVFRKPKGTTKVNPMYACVTALGEDVLVGAPDDDTGAAQAGCVHMFESSTGKLVRTFLNPTPTAGDLFGNWIAAAGNNVLIGAAGATTGGKRTGAAYLFDCGTGRLLSTFLSPAPGEAGKEWPGDAFGRCVAFVGKNTLIGASCDDTGAEDAGAAYLFDGTTGKILHKFLNPKPADTARFGVQVAASGNNILIAAYDPYGKGHGAVYLFKGVD